jgi:hypothetical protein
MARSRSLSFPGACRRSRENREKPRLLRLRPNTPQVYLFEEVQNSVNRRFVPQIDFVAPWVMGYGLWGILSKLPSWGVTTGLWGPCWGSVSARGELPSHGVSQEVGPCPG